MRVAAWLVLQTVCFNDYRRRAPRNSMNQYESKIIFWIARTRATKWLHSHFNVLIISLNQSLILNWNKNGFHWWIREHTGLCYQFITTRTQANSEGHCELSLWKTRMSLPHNYNLFSTYIYSYNIIIYYSYIIFNIDNLFSVAKSNKIKVKRSFLVSKSHEKVSFGDLWSVAHWFPKGTGTFDIKSFAPRAFPRLLVFVCLFFFFIFHFCFTYM